MRRDTPYVIASVRCGRSSPINPITAVAHAFPTIQDWHLAFLDHAQTLSY